MWHIPINAKARSLLYTTETLDQFEGLLWFFEKLSNEDDGTWSEKIVNDFEAYGKLEDYLLKVDDFSDELDYEYDDPQETITEKEYKSREDITIMEYKDMKNSDNEAVFEIEKNMRVFHRIKSTDTGKIQDYVESIAAHYPLLGICVLDEKNLRVVEKVALDSIKILLDHRQVHSWAYLAVFITIIQYAKNWQRSTDSGFWAYICEQLGYKSSQQIYDVLTVSVKEACKNYDRLFIEEASGNNSYYSTVLAHSLSPCKSVFALFDFLVKFYRNNLDCSIYEDDPAISRMISVLRERCQGATIDQDEDIHGNVGGIQAGLRSLIIMCPGYMKHFLTKILLQMEVVLSGGELSEKDYCDVLITQWFINKRTEPTVKRSEPKHKRTTEIAFSYNKIKAEYILDEQGEPVIRIPSFRLINRENPILRILSGDYLVYSEVISIYGNDYTTTSEEIVIPLSNLSDANFINLRVEIVIDNRLIYTSERNLNTKILLFKNKKSHINSTIEEGNYVIFAPKAVNIKFDGKVETQRRSYFAQLIDIYIKDEVSIFVDGRLQYNSKQLEGLPQIKLPQTQIEYMEKNYTYPLYMRNDFSITVVGTFDKNNIIITTQSGELLIKESEDTNMCRFSPPLENGVYSVTLADRNTGTIYSENRFFIVDSYSVVFDSNYYLESSEDGNVVFKVDEQQFELSLMGFSSKIKIPYKNGNIQIQIPRIRLLLDGKPLPKDAIWKGNILPSSSLQVYCPDTVEFSLLFDDKLIPIRNSMIGFEYAIGNMVQAYDGNANSVKVSLYISGDRIRLFDVVFKETLRDIPIFNLTQNTLIWCNSQSFIGNKNTMLKFIFQANGEKPIVLSSEQYNNFLSDKFPSKSERYSYQIIAQTPTAFGVLENTLIESDVIFGDRAAVLFRDEALCIKKITLDGNPIRIKSFYIEDITYLGIEELNYTDLSGDYAHYTAKMFYMTINGKRFFTDLNPVDIYLVNEKARRLHISFDCGAGLFIDKRGENDLELYKYVDPPNKLSRYFFIPDFFEYQYHKEAY